MPEKMWKKNFGVGRPEVPENEKVMLSYAGKVGSYPLPTTQCVVCSHVWDMYITWNLISSNFCFYEFFLRWRFGPVFADFLTFLWNFKKSNFENFWKKDFFGLKLGGQKMILEKVDKNKSF